MAKTEAVERTLDFWTEDELAAELNVHVGTLRRWRKQGKGPPYSRLVRKPVYLIEAVEEWLESRSTTPVRSHVIGYGAKECSAR